MMVKSRLYFLMVILGAMALLVLACSQSTPPPEEKSIAVSIDELAEQKQITREITVNAGDSVEVILGSNPTTGFRWSETAGISDQAVVKQMEHKFVSPENETTTAGAPGKEIWTFQALDRGTGTVSMEYSRPWEGGEKGEWTFTLTVTVK